MSEKTEEKKSDDKAVAVVHTDKIVSTRHKIKIGRETIAYTATCGTIVLKEDLEKDGNREAEKPRASIFFVAYTKDGVRDPAKRPITFSFNGGPGSSSVWLHMGLFGPKRVKMSGKGDPGKPPYALTENEFSLLDQTDFVFIDPVGTGYSRMLDGEKVGEYHNFQRDLESVGEFIRLYLSRNERWASPKFIAGESYGTTRAAGLSRLLQEKYSLYVNGLMLISCVLEFSSVRFGAANDLPHILFLPTFALTARYHGKLDAALSKKPTGAFIAEVEAFAAGEYTSALFLGDKLPAARRAALVKSLARYTGLTTAYIEATNLRINIHRFCKELLRDRRQTVGRLDSRFTGVDRDAAGELYEADAAHNLVDGAFAACLNDYVRRELKFESDTPYTLISRLYLTWDFGAKNEALNVAETLRKTMSASPGTKVYMGQGWYDLATPHYAADYVLAHMALEPHLRKNVEMHYYAAGHMMYIDQAELKAQSNHLRAFLKKAL